ncbi:Alpha/Beta hydrolase protein [Zychaea mexicana]|uniref:Alpha/Beta hydrolase protein n=1 Tax=Zychaea mexicana TaxID=64656 RepID=UPI0022FDC975|nr:Alpha/Beta hydrolase protein [Zychaea mexicana]KAI9496549.1 Alpha/Beta hydrolase protein [Zychaea mexicana]
MDPSDPTTFNHQYCNVNGIRMHYIDENQSSKKALLLIHGWPDLWCGWREQIPFLVKLGYRVVVPTLRGFGESDAPADHVQYGEQTLSNDFAGLLDYLQIPTVVVVGHDWGGVCAWRFTQFYPNRVVAVASFCTPYSRPEQQYLPLEELVKLVPNFTYQLYLTTPSAAAEIDENTEAFFKRMFRPISEQVGGGGIIDEQTKTLIAGRPPVPKSDKLPQKVLDYYVEKYQKRGAAGCLNYYKRRKVNFEECKDLEPIIHKPAMMVTADGDVALPPSMAKGMEKSVPNVEVFNVKNAGHWVLWEQPEECNSYLKQWLSKIYPAQKL